jgi:DNA-directed RNA polymerase subunit RPC12/RpoP
MDLLCGKCGKSFPVDEAQTAADVNCPHCAAPVRVATLSSEPAPLPPEEADEFLIKARLALKKKMLLLCPGCSLRLVVKQKMSGKVIQCPACSHQLTVPEGFMPPDAEAAMQPSAQAGAQASAVQAGFRMPAIAVYEDSSPVRWLAAAVAAIILATAAGFATGYFVLAAQASHPAVQQAMPQPAPAAAAPSPSAAPENAAPANPENRVVR